MWTPPTATKWKLIRVRAEFIRTLVTSDTSCCMGTRFSQKRAVFHPQYRCGTFIPRTTNKLMTPAWNSHVAADHPLKHSPALFSELNRKLSQAPVPVNMSSRFSYQSSGLARRADFDGLRPGAGGWTLYASKKRTNGYQISFTTGIRSTRQQFDRISTTRLHSYNYSSQWYTGSRAHNRLPSQQTPLYFKLADITRCSPILHCLINTLNCVKWCEEC